MSQSALKLVQGKFAEYYRAHSQVIPAPTRYKEREFGFLSFEKVVIRHKKFEEEEQLRLFIKTFVPSDVYYSAAYYERPEESMDLKGWLGSDLVFDVDADHLDIACRRFHDLWLCLDCGHADFKGPPASCAKCGSQRFKERTWLCENCLEATKGEILKLIEFLEGDFGFSSDEIDVYFSGHRGYHVRIESEEVHKLDQFARKEIIDFVCGIGLEPKYHGLDEVRLIVGPSLDDRGWRGHIARGVYEFIRGAGEEQLKSIGLSKGEISSILKYKDVFLDAWKRRGSWSALGKLSLGSWKKILGHVTKDRAVKADSIVTTDIHRLVRLPETLHGKTGLKIVKVPIGDLDSFDPLLKSVAFKEGELSIYVEDSPKFRIGDQEYGPYKESKVEAPTAVAVYLLLKGVAKPL